MLHAFIAGCYSLREIEAPMQANGNRLYHAGLKGIKRATFCGALEKRKQEILKSVFVKLVDKAQGISGKAKKKFKDPLRIIDAAIISVCLERFNWAEYRKAKGAVKLHMNLDGGRRIPFDAYMTDGKVREVKAMKNLTGETGVIHALDRGYVDYKSLYSIELQGSIFVTRRKSNGAFKRTHNKAHKAGGSILSGVLIELTGAATKKAYPRPLRKIKYKDTETKVSPDFTQCGFFFENFYKCFGSVVCHNFRCWITEMREFCRKKSEAPALPFMAHFHRQTRFRIDGQDEGLVLFTPSLNLK
jgi:hypothetical protein